MTDSARQLWEKGTALNGTIVETYILGLGATYLPKNVRFSLAERTIVDGREAFLPAALFAYRMQKGVQCIERHLLDPDTGKLAHIDRFGDPKNGVWVPCDPAPKLGIAMGTVAALQAAKHVAFPVGAVASREAAEDLEPPKGTEHFIFIEDAQNGGLFTDAFAACRQKAISAETHSLFEGAR